MKKETTIVNLPGGQPAPEAPPKGEIPLVPVYYRPKYVLPLIRMYAREGMTIAQIAEQCGISTREFAIWRSRYPDVDIALSQGYRVARAVVENALFEAATGSRSIVTSVHVEKTNEQGEVSVEDRVTISESKPDVKAQIFILKNIAPDRWKDKQELDVENELTINWNEVTSKLSPEQLKAVKAKKE